MDEEIDLGAIDWGDNDLQSYEDFVNQMTDESGNWIFDVGSEGTQNSVIDWLSGIASTFGTDRKSVV